MPILHDPIFICDNYTDLKITSMFYCAIVTCAIYLLHLLTVFFLVLLFISRLPGFALVPYYAPTPCHMHPIYNCHHMKWFPPSLSPSLPPSLPFFHPSTRPSIRPSFPPFLPPSIHPTITFSKYCSCLAAPVLRQCVTILEQPPALCDNVVFMPLLVVGWLEAKVLPHARNSIRLKNLPGYTLEKKPNFITRCCSLGPPEQTSQAASWSEGGKIESIAAEVLGISFIR